MNANQTQNVEQTETKNIWINRFRLVRKGEHMTVSFFYGGQYFNLRAHDNFFKSVMGLPFEPKSKAKAKETPDAQTETPAV